MCESLENLNEIGLTQRSIREFEERKEKVIRIMQIIARHPMNDKRYILFSYAFSLLNDSENQLEELISFEKELKIVKKYREENENLVQNVFQLKELIDSIIFETTQFDVGDEEISTYLQTLSLQIEAEKLPSVFLALGSCLEEDKYTDEEEKLKEEYEVLESYEKLRNHSYDFSSIHPSLKKV